MQGGRILAVIKTNSEQTRLLARLMRAEAEGEGSLGMLMVGNVGVNRILGNCLDFNNIRSIRDMVYQSPGGFEAPQKSYFYQRPENRISGLRNAPLTANGFGRLRMLYGFFAPRAAVRQLGLTNRIRDATKAIASSVPRARIARTCIDRGKTK